VVSQVGHISDAMEALRPRREQVNAVGGAGEYANGKRKSMSPTVGTSNEEWTRDRTKPRGSRENPDSTLSTPKTLDPGIARACVFVASSGDT
jgi:hypothetical protein